LNDELEMVWIEAAPAEVQMKATPSLLAWNNCTSKLSGNTAGIIQTTTEVN
jgi:hypothetical protein